MKRKRADDLDELEGITEVDLKAAIAELGPPDGTDANTDAIFDRMVDIALARTIKEANGKPFRFMGRTYFRSKIDAGHA